MKRTLSLSYPGSNGDAMRYRLLVDTIVVGGTVANQQNVTSMKGLEALRSQARLLRVVKPLGDGSEAQQDEPLSRARLPAISRVPVQGTHVLTFEQQDIEVLKEYIGKIPWHGSISDAVEDLYDWICGAEEVRD